MGSAIQQRLKKKEVINALKSELHQKHIIIDSDSSRFKLLRCGRKFRKTTLQINTAIRMALETGLVCPYVAPNRVQAKNIAWNDHVQRELNILKSLKYPFKINASELSVSFPNGGKIQLMGVENKEALRGISNWGAFFGDELDDWDEDIWPTIIRPNLMTHKAPAILSGTPKGMRYIYRLEYPIDGRKIFKVFHYSSYDNPDLPRDELNEMVNEYKSYGDDFFQQEVMAEYRKPVGLVYKDWDTKNFKPIEYDSTLPLHISFDWGVNDPTAIIWIQPGGGEYRVIDYYEKSDMSIDKIAEIIKSKPYKEPSMCTGDPSGESRSITTNTSPIEELSKHGIFVKVKHGVKIQDQIRETRTIIPSLFVSKKAERFKDILLNYRYPTTDEKRTKFTANENPVHDEFSHGARALEYYAVNVKDFTSKSGAVRTYGEKKILKDFVGYGTKRKPKDDVRIYSRF